MKLGGVLLVIAVLLTAAGCGGQSAPDKQALDRAYEHGEAVGFSKGRLSATARISAARHVGYEQGYRAGKRAGYQAGFQETEEEAESSSYPPPLEEEEEYPPEGEEEASECDPNYTGCVPNTGYDVNCDEVNGPVEVIGTDVDGLDGDGDGIGCE